MNKINTFLDELDESELEIMEKDLKEGYIQKYIDKKKEFFKIKGKTCPVCGNIVDDDCFVLVWGEPSIRKKAYFCGIDCLEYYINNFIKNRGLKSGRHKKTSEKK